MNKNTFKNSMMLMVASFFWGTTFVAQDVAADILPTFTYNALRSAVACVFLSTVINIFDKAGYITEKPKTAADKKYLRFGGIVCGVVLFFSTNLQQLGLKYTTAGKAGFITALYIVLVPLVGVFFKKKTTLFLKLGVVIALVGMYLLCITESLTIGRGDFLVFICSLGFTAHILSVDHFSPKTDGLRLSLFQFITVGILSLGCAIISESATLKAVISCIIPILYAGILSSGVAYTLQILGQKDLNPTIAALIMSVESVFSLIASALVLNERLSLREGTGCILMFAAIILSQLPEKEKLS